MKDEYRSFLFTTLDYKKVVIYFFKNKPNKKMVWAADIIRLKEL